MIAYIKLFSAKMNLTFISKRASFYWFLSNDFMLLLFVCSSCFEETEKKTNVKNIANVLYCLSLVKGWVILILVLRCVGWIWYPFSFILRVIYICILNKIISRKQIYQWIISTTKYNQNCIWFGGNFIQSRQTFLYGICLAQVKWSFYFLSGMKFLKSVP